MRLIDADALIDVVDGYLTDSVEEGKCIEKIMDAPSIDAVKHGIWIEENTRPRSSQFYCSVCHRTAYDPQPTRIKGWVKRCRYAYCPNCGARMDGRGES